MSGTLDTLQIVFTAEAGPLTSQLEHITRQLGNVNVASETAQTGLRGLAGAMQGSFSALSDRAYAAGAAAGRALANGLRSQSGAVTSAAEHLAQGASAALRKASSGGSGGGSSRGGGGGSGTVTRFSTAVMSASGGGTSGGGSTNITVPINVDGVRLGEACIRGIERVSDITGRSVLSI
ncbi:MAG: hypothetical protein Q4C31_08245 [Eubacteriales bacterium]|nr:hypothetical protein [Eubacteriales bacterium]